jgi:hypothetical protein
MLTYIAACCAVLLLSLIGGRQFTYAVVENRLSFLLGPLLPLVFGLCYWELHLVSSMLVLPYLAFAVWRGCGITMKLILALGILVWGFNGYALSQVIWYGH